MSEQPKADQEQPSLPPPSTHHQAATNLLNTAINKGWVNTSNIAVQILFVLPAVISSIMGQSDLEEKNEKLMEQNNKLTVLIQEQEKQNNQLKEKSKELTEQLTKSLQKIENTLNIVISEGKKLQYRVLSLESHTELVYPKTVEEYLRPQFDVSTIYNNGFDPLIFSFQKSLQPSRPSNIDPSISNPEIKVPKPSVNFDE